MKKIQNSLFIRLILIFLAAILPILVGNQILNNWVYNNIRKNTVDYAADKLSTARTALEEAVNNIHEQTQFMLSNNQILGFFILHNNMTDAERYVAIKSVQNLLKYLCSVNPYLSEIRLCLPASNMEVTPTQYRLIESEMLDAINMFEKTGVLLYDRDGVLHFGNLITFGEEKSIYLDAEINMQQVTATEYTSSADAGALSFIANHQAHRLYPAKSASFTGQLFTLLNSHGKENKAAEVSLDGMKLLMISDYSPSLDCSFVELLPEGQIFRFPILFRRYLNLLMVLLFIGIIFYFFLIFRQVQHPIRRLIRHFERTNVTNLSQPVDIRSNIYEYRTLAKSCNEMNARIQRLIDENYETTIRYQQAELKQLHAQINPHFLYNSFFILRHSISERRLSHAERLAGYLGKYFEYIADQSHHMVPFIKEYDFAVTYLNIQMIRFEGGIRADIEELPASIREMSVPHLILQPLFENALEHGITTIDGEGLIRLRFVTDGQTVQIHVEDNGNLLTDEQLENMRSMLIDPTPEQEQHALVNTHKRLRITYGPMCGLTFSRSDLGGLWVTMTILRAEEENT